MSDSELELQPETVPALNAGPRPRAPETAEPAPPEPEAEPVAAKATGFPWELSPLAMVPMDELLAEIERRHARARVLIAERERILEKLAALEAEMGIVASARSAANLAMPPAAERGPRRQRARNSVSLADALAQAIEVRATISPAEAAQLVLSNGYLSTAKNFGMVVANALAKDKRFERRSRGLYERVAE
jgi:hypothetical protein